MIFVDVEFYKYDYLLGRAAVIPLTEFEFWARKASERINREKLEFEDNEIPDYLANCTCEVAEMYYNAEQANSLTSKRSESVGGYSVSYADQSLTHGQLEANIGNVIRKWLANTELHNLFIYRGVY